MTSPSSSAKNARSFPEDNGVTGSNEDVTVDNTTTQLPTNADVATTDPESNLIGQYSIKVTGANGGATLPVSIMRFIGSGVDPGEWKGCKMIRDIKRPPKVIETAGINPAEGGGSEFRSEAREKAEQRKREKYRKKPVVRKDQPWLMKLTEVDKKKKRFRGTKVGGLTDHSAYYVLILCGGGVQAIPVTSMFDFKSIERYNNLTAEEAEEKFLKRHQTYNYFSIMTRKRLRNEESNEKDNFKGVDAKKGKYLGSGGPDRVNSEQEGAHKWSDSSDEEDDKKNARTKKNGVTDEDDGSEREVDYMSSSSESSSDDNEERESKEEDDEGPSQLLESSESESDEKSDD
ncbi:unnamed protein product [Orchesella dallaii]|uniref:Transcription initiation factor IIF subunit alpha n=1 Tax=Orchesella dallaii TaxID=48710 RepID=A0ABP1R922_9HEXA